MYLVISRSYSLTCSLLIAQATRIEQLSGMLSGLVTQSNIIKDNRKMPGRISVGLFCAVTDVSIYMQNSSWCDCKAHVPYVYWANCV